ncbi:ribosome maturation factor [Spirochaeta lutea]|uniref:ribosome maturation factor n=1 Tax=Spirochaeta lutea TaxID=1480694 RepID=UPI00068CF197|nr:ribosome maturation factor [Spirochaeta lutea]
MGIELNTLLDQVAPVVEGLGFSLVELNYGNTKGTHQTRVIIYSDQGVGSDECALVYRTLLPRLEIILDSRDIHLEISSPGLDRKIKSPREYEIFTGKQVRLLLRDSQDWIEGTISQSNSDSVTIHQEAGETTVPFSNIVKGQLDYKWEVK